MVPVKPAIRPEVLRVLLAEATRLHSGFRKAHAFVPARILLLPALPITLILDYWLRLLRGAYEQLLEASRSSGVNPRGLARYVVWGLMAKGWDVADDQLIDSIKRFVSLVNKAWLVGVVLWETLFSLLVWYLLIKWLLS